MKNRFERDQEFAAQMDIDATLDVVQSKELLHKSIEDEIEAVDELTATSKKVASSKEKLSDVVVDETDAIKEDASVTKRLATAKKKNAERVRANTKANDHESTVSGDLTVARKQRLKTEQELNKQQPLVDYTPQLNQLNAKLAEELLNKIKGLKAGRRASSKETTIYDKYNKQAEKEYAHRYGLFRRINKSLEKTAKKSESGLARMGSKAMMGAGNMVSEKIDDFLGSIPGVAQAHKGYKFVKENMRDASEAKTKRLVRERAHELRTGDSPKPTPSLLPSVAETKRERERAKDTAQNKSAKKETDARFDKMIEILESIRTTQMIGSIVNLVSTLGSGIMGGLGNLGKVLGGPLMKMAGAATALAGTVGALGSLLPSSTPDVDLDVDKDKKTKYKDRKKPSAKAPKVTRPTTPAPNPQAAKKGVGTIIKKVMGAAAKSPARLMLGMGARLLGPVGLAYTAYELADSFGAVDAAKEFLGKNLGELFGGGEEGQVPESEGLDMATPAPDRSSQIDDAIETAREEGRGRADGWNEDADAPRITNSGRVILPDEKVEFEPGEKFISGTFAEVDKMVAEERKRQESEAMQQSAQATAAAVNGGNINSTTVNNFNGGNSTSSGSSIPAFGNEYQTSHQKGSMIQR